MGILEETRARQRKKHDLKKIVLGTVAAFGVLSVALVAPNVLGAMGKLGLVPGKRQKESINAARVRLVRKGWLERNKQGFLRITSRGEKELLKLQVRDNGLPKPK